MTSLKLRRLEYATRLILLVGAFAFIISCGRGIAIPATVISLAFGIPVGILSLRRARRLRRINKSISLDLNKNEISGLVPSDFALITAGRQAASKRAAKAKIAYNLSTFPLLLFVAWVLRGECG